MLRVILSQNKISLVDEATGLNLGVPVTKSYKSVAIEYESASSLDVSRGESQSETTIASAAEASGDGFNVSALAPAKKLIRKRRSSKKSITDYIEQVFLEQDRPLLMVDIVELVVESGYKPTSKHYKNTIRSQAYRNRPTKFCQYDENIWGLTRLNDRWKREGKLAGLTLDDEAEGVRGDSSVFK